MDKKTFKIVLSILITLSLVYFLLNQIELNDLVVLFNNISPFWLLVAFILYGLSYLARAIRFKIVLNSKLDTKRLFRIVSVHTMMNNLLPARTGELSYIYLIIKEKLKASKAVSSLIIVRVFDFIIITIIFLIAVLFLNELPSIVSSSLPIVFVLSILAIISLSSLIFLRAKLVLFGENVFHKLGIDKFSFVTRILKALKNVLLGFKSIESKRRIALIFLLSVVLWFLQYSALYVIIVSIGVSIPLVFLIITFTFRNISFMLPLQGIGGFGIIEGSWALALIMFGIDKNLAISTGFFNHIIVIFYSLVLGVYGLIKLRKKLF